MRCFTKLYRKALFRQPIRMLLLVLILAAACFAFTSHAAEAILVAQRTSELEQYYSPVGYLSGNQDVREGQKIVSECPYLELEDIRRRGSVKLLEMQNPDVDGAKLAWAFYRHTNESVFVGNLEKKQFVEAPKGKGGYYEMDFRVKSVEASYKEYMTEGRLIHVRSLPGIEEEADSTRGYYPKEQDETLVAEYGELEEGKDYLLRGYYYEDNWLNAVWSARQGRAGACLILLPLLPGGGVLPTEGVLPTGSTYFYEVSDGMERAEAGLEELSDYVEYLNHNLHMMYLQGTKDMSRIPKFQESAKWYYLVEGRMLTQEDDREERKVCVIHENFAKLRGLQTGDILRVELEEDQGGWGGYTLWEDWPEWKKKEGGVKQTMELEIVGLYSELLYPYLSSYGMQIFVPNSCLPSGYETESMENEGENRYSFVLQKPEDQSRFLEEYGERLEQAGYQVVFVENNAEHFLKTAEELRRSTIGGTLLFGVVLAAVLLAACGLYLAQRRKEYAIARALGLPAGRAAFGLAAAFGWVLLPGVLLGGILGWQNMLQDAEETLQALANVSVVESSVLEEDPEEEAVIEDIPAEEASVRGKLEISWLIGILFAISLTAFLLLIAYGLLLARKPVLPLLQGSGRQKKEPARGMSWEEKPEAGQKARQNRETERELQLGEQDGRTEKTLQMGGEDSRTGKVLQPSREDSEEAESQRQQSHRQQGSEQREQRREARGQDLRQAVSQRSSFPAKLRYLRRHILRTKAKALLLVLLGMGMVFLFEWMKETVTFYQEEVERLYRDTVIEGEIRKIDSSASLTGQDGGGAIPPDIVTRLEETDLSSKTYLEESAVAETVWLTDETGRIREEQSASLKNVPLLGLHEWEPFLEETGSSLEVQFYHGYNGTHFLREREPQSEEEREVIVPEWYLEQFHLGAGDLLILSYTSPENKRETSAAYRIIGSYQEHLEHTDKVATSLQNALLIQGTAMQDLVGTHYYYLTARFTFDSQKNRELLAREAELKDIVSGEQGFSFLRLFIWDEELHQVVEPLEHTLSLFDILYPLAVAVSLALGFGFPFLLLLQRRQEAATMRILGSSARSVGLLLGVEQLLLCLAGMVLGLLLSGLYYQSLARDIWVAIGLYTLGTLAGVLIGSIAVVRQNPMALLQEKE